jgi:enterochelin esterase family protein
MHDRSALSRLLGLEGSLQVDFLESAALAGNPLGDPATRPVAIYLPPGYDAQSSRRYPALYVLHGYTGDVAALVAARPWETNVVQWADRLIASRRMPPALLVLVDGFTRLGGSQYVDSVHNGPYATYTVREVVGHVDGRYRTIASEGGRAVLGKSSGGFGAMHLVLEHPGVFAAFASHSGDSYFPYAHIPAFATVGRTLEAYGFDIGAYVEAFERKPKRSAAEYTTMEMLAYAAAYSPRSAAAFDFDLPFDCGTMSSRAGWRSIPPNALQRTATSWPGCACAISTAAGATNTISTSARASSRGALPSWGSPSATRNLTTTTATWDTGTKSRSRR